MVQGPSSNVINGQLIPLARGSQYAPQGFGPQTTTVPQMPPTVPPPISGGSTGTMASAAGNGSQTGLHAMLIGNNPWNPKVSPLPWALAGLVIALLMLHFVHYRSSIIGVSEKGNAGPIKEAVGASA